MDLIQTSTFYIIIISLLSLLVFHQFYYINKSKYRIIEYKVIDDNIHCVKMNNGIYMKINKSDTTLNCFITEKEYNNI
jgi:hypothetical protein